MSYHVFLTPMVLLMEFVLVFGIALCLSSLNVYYKDVAQLWDLTLQAGFFLCPIIYSTSLIPRRYVFLYSLNPMAGILESLRKIFYYNASPTLSDIIIPLTGSLLILLIGSLIFLRLEPKFAEEV